jgi:hypothetical protein
MCSPVNRRSFVASIAALVPAYALLSPTRLFAASAPKSVASPARLAGAPVYVCPPCGLPCDKLTFDKPGSCPQCGMTLIPAGGEGVTTVAMLLYPGVEIIDISGPWEAFGTAGFLVHTVAEKSDPLTLVFNQKVRNFARVFTKEMKTTPAVFIERLRVESVRRRLEESRHSLKKIATESGFRSVSSMRAAFQRLLGIAPGQYRQRFRANRQT